jgi:hypothetical protein
MFHGASKYFEDFVARIDTPATISISTVFFNQLDFDIPHFLQFICRTQIPDPLGGKEFRIAIYQDIVPWLNWQVGFLAQICGKISPFLFNVERLLIAYGSTKNEALLDWKECVDNPQWLECWNILAEWERLLDAEGRGGNAQNE